MRLTRWGAVALAASILASGCRGGKPEIRLPTVPPTEIFFPTVAAPGEEGNDGLIEGELTFDRCVYVAVPIATETHFFLPIWEEGLGVVRNKSGYAVVNESGEVLVSEGEQVGVGGSEWDDPSALYDFGIPAECRSVADDYWRAESSPTRL